MALVRQVLHRLRVGSHVYIWKIFLCQMAMRLFFKWLCGVLVLVVGLINFMAWQHAKSLTHFSEQPIRRIVSDSLSWHEKGRLVVFGAAIGKPASGPKPHEGWQAFRLTEGGPALSGWYWPADSAAKGTVLLFHGYLGTKSSMTDKAEAFHRMGYHAAVIDFRASGESEGHVCSIGYHEAQDVARLCAYIRQQGEEHILLYGTSMGAAAVLQAMSSRPPAGIRGIILECPFGSLTEAVAGRLRLMGLPSSPLAELLTFWGGVQQGFRGAAFRPELAAGAVQVPTLLLYGSRDQRVTRAETDRIFEGLSGPKTLYVFEGLGHENYLSREPEAWHRVVKHFVGGL